MFWFPCLHGTDATSAGEEASQGGFGNVILLSGSPCPLETDSISVGGAEAFPGSTRNCIMSSGSPGSPGFDFTSACEEEASLGATKMI